MKIFSKLKENRKNVQQIFKIYSNVKSVFKCVDHAVMIIHRVYIGVYSPVIVSPEQSKYASDSIITFAIKH